MESAVKWWKVLIIMIMVVLPGIVWCTVFFSVLVNGVKWWSAILLCVLLSVVVTLKHCAEILKRTWLTR